MREAHREPTPPTCHPRTPIPPSVHPPSLAPRAQAPPKRGIYFRLPLAEGGLLLRSREELDLLEGPQLVAVEVGAGELIDVVGGEADGEVLAEAGGADAGRMLACAGG